MIFSSKMLNDDSDSWEHPYNTTVKVHRLSCLQLKKFSDKISQIFTAIESARPRCESGIQALCRLHISMEKTSLLLQHCSESSKLYLAITVDKILLRFEKIQNSLVLCLSQIQNMVPSKLAVQISKIVDDINIATFTVEPTEYEAGRALLALLHGNIVPTSSANIEELKAFKYAAFELNITSPTAVLIEKRSIKWLLGKVNDTDPTKKKILSYFMYLLRKYGASIGTPHAVGSLVPPEEFKCPLSMRLMSDPVTISNGKTFERLWIEKWFNEGHGTCPKSRTELLDLSMTPNFVLKDLISKWRIQKGITGIDPSLHTWSSSRRFPKISSSRSIASLYSSLDGLQLQVSNISIRSSDTNNDVDSVDAMKEDVIGCEMNGNEPFPAYRSTSSNDHGINLSFLAKLSALPWTSRRNAVEDVKNQLNDIKGSHSMISTSYIKPLLKFLKDAVHFCDLRAQRDGAELLLILLRKLSEVPLLPKDTFDLLTSFLESGIAGEIFAIMEVLTTHKYYKNDIVASGVLSSILRVLDDPISNHHLPALKTLCSFSVHTEIGYHMIYLGYISKLVPFLDDLILAGHCLKIFKNLCNIEDAATEIMRTDNCITSIGELLEICTDEEQQLCLELLLSLCYQNEEFCGVVMTQSIISSVLNLSIDGNSKAKLIATEFLQLGKKVKEGHSLGWDTNLHPGIVKDSENPLQERRNLDCLVETETYQYSQNPVARSELVILRPGLGEHLAPKNSCFI